MSEVRFYHLTRRTLEETLPALLQKAYDRGLRAVVRSTSAERVESLNAHLWTFAPESFLPHGSAADGNAADQPIWLTVADENPNGASLLVLADGADAEDVSAYATVCDLFDGNDEAAVTAARERWRRWKAQGHGVTYWQQGERGGWEQKA
jgi:DNA polymerase-3 subunit chi